MYNPNGLIDVYNYSKSIVELAKHDRLLTEQELTSSPKQPLISENYDYLLTIGNTSKINIIHKNYSINRVSVVIEDTREPLEKLRESDEYPISAQYIKSEENKIQSQQIPTMANENVLYRSTEYYTERVANNYKYDRDLMNRLYCSDINALSVAISNHIAAIANYSDKQKTNRYISADGVINATRNLTEFQSSEYYNAYTENRFPKETVSESTVGSKFTINIDNTDFNSQLAGIIRKLTFIDSDVVGEVLNGRIIDN